MGYQELKKEATKLRTQADKIEQRARRARQRAMFPVGTEVRIINAPWERFNGDIGKISKVWRDLYEYIVDFPGRDECFKCEQCPGHKRSARIGDEYVERVS